MFAVKERGKHLEQIFPVKTDFQENHNFSQKIQRMNEDLTVKQWYKQTNDVN